MISKEVLEKSKIRMTAKEVERVLELAKDYKAITGQAIDNSIIEALEELESIKSADGGVAMKALKYVGEHFVCYLYGNPPIDLKNDPNFDTIKNHLLKSQAQERELRELKATIKELLDIPITVSTFNGTSLLVKTMNKLNKLVGDKDE